MSTRLKSVGKFSSGEGKTLCTTASARMYLLLGERRGVHPRVRGIHESASSGAGLIGVQW